MAIGAVGAAIFLILAVFAIGYVVAFVLPPRELVVSVNDVKYTRGDLVELVRIKQRSAEFAGESIDACLLYTSPSPRDGLLSRMPSSA